MALKAVSAPLGSPVGGSGTTGTIPVWSGSGTTLGDSQLIQSATVIYTTTRNFGVGTGSSAASAPLHAFGPAADWTAKIQGSTTSGSSYGLLIRAGTTSADTALSVQGPTGTPSFLVVRGDGRIIVGNDGTAAAPIIANSTGVSGLYFPSATTAAIAANGAIAATFSRVAGAGVALGSTTGLIFDASGTQQGLKLPATPGNADTQTLDCYAEGTWTPTITGFGGTTPTITARYVRVGRLVTLSVLVSPTGGATFSSTATATYISLPAGMTPTTASQPGATSNSGIAADGPCVAYTNGNLYLPTFALRAADTFLNVTYML